MLKTNKKTSGSYFLTDPIPKVKITDPDTIKLNKQVKTIKNVVKGTAAVMGGSYAYGKWKQHLKKKKKNKEKD